MQIATEWANKFSDKIRVEKMNVSGKAMGSVDKHGNDNTDNFFPVTIY